MIIESVYLKIHKNLKKDFDDLLMRQWSRLVKIRASQGLEIACDPGSNPG